MYIYMSPPPRCVGRFVPDTERHQQSKQSNIYRSASGREYSSMSYEDWLRETTTQVGGDGDGERGDDEGELVVMVVVGGDGDGEGETGR